MSDERTGDERTSTERTGDDGDRSDGADVTGDRLVGRGVARREDRALLTGEAAYTDDLTPPDAAHLAFVRSEYAHASIEDVDASAAREVDGVVAVYSWADVAASDAPGVIPIAAERLDCEIPGHPILAHERVRYHGEPIAAVVADSPYAARDGVAAVSVTYDERNVVVDPAAAADASAPTLYEAAPDNVVDRSEMGDREETAAAFADADRIVDLDLENNRLIPSALEPRAALARWDAADERLTVEMTSQSPHGHRRKLAATLGMPERRIRVVSPSVGGGFGHKGHHHPGEAMAAWAAMALDRPVTWTATRSENYLAGAHGRDHRTTAAIAVDGDGTIRGLRVETIANVGGYGLGVGPAMPAWYGRLLSSQYTIPAIHCETQAVVTNTAPVHSYRGAGRPEAIYVTERLIELAARELGMDSVELRRRNLIPADAFPYETAVGAEYDSGDYEETLDRALEAADVDALPHGGERDDDGRYRGVGVACYVESTGGGYESGLVRVHPDGGVTVYAGSHSHGQGHETTYAQIVADELEIPPDEIDVVEGDTDAIPRGIGTFGSRSTIAAGNAVREGAREVLAKARRIAANRLDADLDEVAYADGEFVVEREREDERLSADGGDPQAGEGVPFAEVTGAAYGRSLPEGMEPGLESTCFYEPGGTAYTFGTHVAAVAVDPETGALDIDRYVAVDDCGPRVNPIIVEGQVHGGVAQGLGQVRSEQAVYGEDGRLRTNSMLSYGIPRAADIPRIETAMTETPSPHNPLGVKGIGEAGPIAAPPAVVNAVCDALTPLGVDHVEMPLTQERLWRAIHGDSA